MFIGVENPEVGILFELVKFLHKKLLADPESIKKLVLTFLPFIIKNHATILESPFRRVGLEIIGPLPKTKSKNKYIIVLVDYFTKWVEAEPLTTIESNDVIKFLTRVFSHHGIPEVLITDNGPQFTSDTTKGFLDLYGVYVHYTSTHHPESNGPVEKRNREIGKYLRLLGNNQKDWDEILLKAKNFNYK